MKLRRFALPFALGSALAAFAALSFADPPKSGYVPDPPGVSSKKQWTIDVPVRQGKPTLASAKLVELDKPASTARVMGRFAVEFWIGKELLDRVRFDVPLLEDPAKRRNRRVGTPEFAVNTRLTVRLADSDRATSIVLVDRATGDVQAFAWPPGSDGKLVPLPKVATSSSDAGTDAPAQDAGAGDSG